MPTRNDYERVLAVVQATEDNTTLQIDFNGDGVFDSFNTENGYRTARADPVDATTLLLQKGQAYVLDRNSDGVRRHLLTKDAVILGDKTLQVEWFYGRDASNYDTRAVSAYPRGFWTKEYYASADGGNTGVCPAASATRTCCSTTPTPAASPSTGRPRRAAGASPWPPTRPRFFQAKTGAYVPNGSGVYLSGTDTFWGTSDIDSNRNDWDWGYSLVPSYLLSDEQTVAWAPGNSPPLACNAANGAWQRLVPHARPRQHHLLHRRQRGRDSGHQRQHRGPPWHDGGGRHGLRLQGQPARFALHHGEQLGHCAPAASVT